MRVQRYSLLSTRSIINEEYDSNHQKKNCGWASKYFYLNCCFVRLYPLSQHSRENTNWRFFYDFTGSNFCSVATLLLLWNDIVFCLQVNRMFAANADWSKLSRVSLGNWRWRVDEAVITNVGLPMAYPTTMGVGIYIVFASRLEKWIGNGRDGTTLIMPRAANISWRVSITNLFLTVWIPMSDVVTITKQLVLGCNKAGRAIRIGVGVSSIFTSVLWVSQTGVLKTAKVRFANSEILKQDKNRDRMGMPEYDFSFQRECFTDLTFDEQCTK